MRNTEDMSNGQMYQANLTLDELIAQLQAMKAAGAPGGRAVHVDVYQAPCEDAEARPNYPRAEWMRAGVVTFTCRPSTLPVLSVIIDGN